MQVVKVILGKSEEIDISTTYLCYLPMNNAILLRKDHLPFSNYNKMPELKSFQNSLVERTSDHPKQDTNG